MDQTATGFPQLLTLFLSPDYGLWGMIGLSLLTATAAMAVSAALALPLAYGLTGDPLKRERGWRRGLTDLVYALMAMPGVLVGLVIYLTLSNGGPLGVSRLAFSPLAVVVAQSLLVLPLMVGLFGQAFGAIPARYSELALSAGATPTQTFTSLLRQAMPWLVAALATGYARLLGETGAALLAGGNLLGSTRTMATGIAWHVQRGDFFQATGLGLVLIAIGMVVAMISRRGRRP